MASWLLSFAAFLMLGYALLAWLLWRGLQRLSSTPVEGPTGETPFSILIPCRDDTAPLKHTLAQLPAACAGSFAAWEVLVINDHSRPDESKALESLLASYPSHFRLIRHRGQAGKKAALQTGLAHARYELIVQTDADTRLDRGALVKLLAPFSASKTAFAFGVVRMLPAGSLAGRFAALEYLSLQMSGQALAATGRPYMGSAANMAYRKSRVQGLALPGEHWQSGDDVFLMQALHRETPGSVRAVLSAGATTPSPATWGAFFRQRIRWGGKAVAYPLVGSRLLAAGVALHSWGIGLLWVLALIWPQAAFYALLVHGSKAVLDAPLLGRYARATQQRGLLRDYAWVAGLYPFYILLVTGLMALPFRWRWKGNALKEASLSGES
jgi:cellulose synthase/poly-beta-1,6-N-acetylglucosamine synthase-like glycosyltransferase